MPAQFTSVAQLLSAGRKRHRSLLKINTQTILFYFLMILQLILTGMRRICKINKLILFYIRIFLMVGCLPWTSICQVPPILVTLVLGTVHSFCSVQVAVESDSLGGSNTKSKDKSPWGSGIQKLTKNQSRRPRNQDKVPWWASSWGQKHRRRGRAIGNGFLFSQPRFQVDPLAVFVMLGTQGVKVIAYGTLYVPFLKTYIWF